MRVDAERDAVKRLSHLLEGFPLGRLCALLGHRLREFVHQAPAARRGVYLFTFILWQKLGRVDGCSSNDEWRFLRDIERLDDTLLYALVWDLGGWWEDGTRRAEEKIEVLSQDFVLTHCRLQFRSNSSTFCSRLAMKGNAVRACGIPTVLSVRDQLFPLNLA